MTDEHPLYRTAPAAGGSAGLPGWTAARSLAAGDEVLGDSGVLTVIANAGEAHRQGVKVYNLEVEQAHTYFVLAEHAPDDADAVWVHNAEYSLQVKEPRVLTNTTLSAAEKALVMKHFAVKARALKSAAARGELRWSPGTDSVRIAELQTQYRNRVAARFERRFGQQLDMSRLNADHRVDLIVGGLADQRLQMIHESVNKSVGAALYRAGVRAGLSEGDLITKIDFIKR